MRLPKNISIKQKKYLKELYDNTYNSLIKNKDVKKAKAVAKAKVNEELFKIFCKKEGVLDINEQWKSKKKYSYIKENTDFKNYRVNNIDFVVSTDKKILEKFSEAERKGMIRDMKDEYEQEVLFKAKEKYGVQLSPDMFYVIK